MDRRQAAVGRVGLRARSVWVNLLLEFSVLVTLNACPVRNEGLEVADFDHLALPGAIFDQRIYLHWILRMLRQQLLNLHIIKQLALGQAEDFERLKLCDEAALDPQPFLGNLLPADVLMLLAEGLVVLLLQVGLDLEVLLLRGQRPVLELRILFLLS